jgi:biopolymer transport protein ExbD/biopolymer transport protein TolR
MAFDVGSASNTKKGFSRPEMNVTPLVDVVLVLLIVFMVLTAAMNEMFWVHVPEKDQKQDDAQEDSDPDKAPIVVSVNVRGQIQINSDVYSDADFSDRLRRMLVARGERRIYFDAERGVPFERAMQVLDHARGAGAAHIAVATEKLTP